MAEFFTLASFTIPCSRQQAEVALASLTSLREEAKLIPLSGEQADHPPEAIIINHCLSNHPEFPVLNKEQAPGWEFICSVVDDGLWIRSDESINTREAAIFTQSVLLAFELNILVEIQASHVSRKDRADSYGGHACTVTRDKIQFFNFSGDIEAEKMAFETNSRFYFCSVNESNGPNEYKDRFLMKCSNSSNAYEEFKRIASNLFGKVDAGEDDTDHLASSELVNGYQFKEIEPSEFQTLQRFLTVREGTLSVE